MKVLYSFIDAMNRKINQYNSIFQGLKQYPVFLSEIEMRKCYKQFQRETLSTRLEMSYQIFKDYMFPEFISFLKSKSADIDFEKLFNAYPETFYLFKKVNTKFVSLYDESSDVNTYSTKNVFQKFIEVNDCNIADSLIIEFIEKLTSNLNIGKSDFSHIFEYHNPTYQRYFNVEMNWLYNDLLGFKIQNDKSFIVPKSFIDNIQEMVSIRCKIENKKGKQDDAELYKNSVEMFLLCNYNIDENFSKDFNKAYNSDLTQYHCFVPEQASLKSGVHPSKFLTLEHYLKFHFKSSKLLMNLFLNQKVKTNTQFQLEKKEKDEFGEFVEKASKDNPFFKFDNSLAVERAFIINQYFPSIVDELRASKSKKVLTQLKAYHKNINSSYKPYTTSIWSQIQNTVKLLHMFDVSRQTYSQLRKYIKENNALSEIDIKRLISEACDFIINVSFGNAQHFPSTLRETEKNQPATLDGQYKEYFFKNRVITEKYRKIPIFIKEDTKIKEWYDVRYSYSNTMTTADFLAGYEYCFVETLKNCENRLNTSIFEFWKDCSVKKISQDDNKVVMMQHRSKMFVEVVDKILKQVIPLLNEFKTPQNIPIEIIEKLSFSRIINTPSKEFDGYIRETKNISAKVEYIEEAIKKFLIERDGLYERRYNMRYDEDKKLALFTDITTGNTFKIAKDKYFSLREDIWFLSQKEKRIIQEKNRNSRKFWFRRLEEKGLGFRLGFDVKSMKRSSFFVVLVPYEESLEEIANISDINDINGLYKKIDNLTKLLNFDENQISSYLIKLQNLRNVTDYKRKARSAIFSIKFIFEKMMMEAYKKKVAVISAFQYCKSVLNSFIRGICIKEKFSFLHCYIRC